MAYHGELEVGQRWGEAGTTIFHLDPGIVYYFDHRGMPAWNLETDFRVWMSNRLPVMVEPKMIKNDYPLHLDVRREGKEWVAKLKGDFPVFKEGKGRSLMAAAKKWASLNLHLFEDDHEAIMARIYVTTNIGVFAK
jgi:hypothetical protein